MYSPLLHTVRQCSPLPHQPSPPTQSPCAYSLAGPRAVRSWLPCLDQQEHRCPWRIFVAVRRGVMAIASGFLKRKVRQETYSAHTTLLLSFAFPLHHIAIALRVANRTPCPDTALHTYARALLVFLAWPLPPLTEPLLLVLIPTPSRQGPSTSDKRLTVFEYELDEPAPASSIGFVVGKFASLREAGEGEYSFHCPLELQPLLRPSARTHARVRQARCTRRT